MTQTKKKKLGISLAALISGVVVLVAGFVLYAAFCYAGRDTTICILLAVSWAVVVVGMTWLAKWLKTSKSYGNLWIVLECSCLALLVMGSLVIALNPLCRLLNAESTQKEKIEQALGNDEQSAEMVVSNYISEKKNGIATTGTDLRLMRVSSSHDRDSLTDRFINDNIVDLTPEAIDLFEEKLNEETEAVRTQVTFYRALNDYRNAFLISRPLRARKLVEEYEKICDQLDDFEQSNPTPRLEANYNQKTIYHAQPVQISQLRQSQFKVVMDDIDDFDIWALLIILLFDVLILFPYIFALRQQVIRTGGKKGKKIGGMPLVYDK